MRRSQILVPDPSDGMMRRVSMTQAGYCARWMRLVRRYHGPPGGAYRHGSAVRAVLERCHPVRSGVAT